MKNAIFFATAILAAFSLANAAFAQQVPQTAACVVDMSEIFKSHPNFESQMANLRRQAEQLQTEIQQQTAALNQEAEQLKMIDVGSPEYKQRETQLAKKTADHEIARRDKLRDLVSREARLHFNTYYEVNVLIASFCDQNGVQLILRHARPAVDEKNPETIMQWVNSDIVWVQPRFDITDNIIEQLNQKYSNNGANGNVQGNNK